MLKRMKEMKKRKGFTLVELIVVIAMIAILAGIAVPSYQGYRERANISSDGQLASVAQTAILTEMAGGSITRKANAALADSIITVTNATKAVSVTIDADGFEFKPNVETAKANLEKLINGGKQSVFLYGKNATSTGVVFTVDANGNVTYDDLDKGEVATASPSTTP